MKEWLLIITLSSGHQMSTIDKEFDTLQECHTIGKHLKDKLKIVKNPDSWNKAIIRRSKYECVNTIPQRNVQ